MRMVDQHRGASNPMLPSRRVFFARLRAFDMDNLHTHEPRDVIPFPGVTTLRPSRMAQSQRLPHLSEDSVAAAEKAVEHFERRLQNLRKLLGEDGSDGPRAA